MSSAEEFAELEKLAKIAGVNIAGIDKDRMLVDGQIKQDSGGGKNVIVADAFSCTTQSIMGPTGPFSCTMAQVLFVDARGPGVKKQDNEFTFASRVRIPRAADEYNADVLAQKEARARGESVAFGPAKATKADGMGITIHRNTILSVMVKTAPTVQILQGTRVVLEGVKFFVAEDEPEPRIECFTISIPDANVVTSVTEMINASRPAVPSELWEFAGFVAGEHAHDPRRKMETFLASGKAIANATAALEHAPPPSPAPSSSSSSSQQPENAVVHAGQSETTLAIPGQIKVPKIVPFTPAVTLGFASQKKKDELQGTISVPAPEIMKAVSEKIRTIFPQTPGSVYNNHALHSGVQNPLSTIYRTDKTQHFPATTCVFCPVGPMGRYAFAIDNGKRSFFAISISAWVPPMTLSEYVGKFGFSPSFALVIHEDRVEHKARLKLNDPIVAALTGCVGPQFYGVIARLLSIPTATPIFSTFQATSTDFDKVLTFRASSVHDPDSVGLWRAVTGAGIKIGAMLAIAFICLAFYDAAVKKGNAATRQIRDFVEAIGSRGALLKSLETQDGINAFWKTHKSVILSNYAKTVCVFPEFTLGKNKVKTELMPHVTNTSIGNVNQSTAILRQACEEQENHHFYIVIPQMPKTLEIKEWISNTDPDVVQETIYTTFITETRKPTDTPCFANSIADEAAKPWGREDRGRPAVFAVNHPVFVRDGPAKIGNLDVFDAQSQAIVDKYAPSQGTKRGANGASGGEPKKITKPSNSPPVDTQAPPPPPPTDNSASISPPPTDNEEEDVDIDMV